MSIDDSAPTAPVIQVSLSGTKSHALLDTGNTFGSCISIEVFYRLPKHLQQLIIQGLPTSIPTAKEGDPLEIVGQLAQPLTLQFSGCETQFRFRPFVVQNFGMDCNIGYAYMSHYGLSIQPDEHAIRVQGKSLPFMTSGSLKDPTTCLYTKKKTVAAPMSITYLGCRVSPETPRSTIESLQSSGGLVHGWPTLQTNLGENVTESLHPWREAVAQRGGA